MKTNNIDKMMADELPEEILFDYAKAKPNRFIVQAIDERDTMQQEE